jgi:hypothetical protein
VRADCCPRIDETLRHHHSWNANEIGLPAASASTREMGFGNVIPASKRQIDLSDLS